MGKKKKAAKAPAYINTEATATPVINEAGGVHASLGGAKPFIVPTQEEVDQAKKEQDAAEAAAKKAKEDAEAAEEAKAA